MDDLDGLEDSDEEPPDRLGTQTGLVEEHDPGCGASVEHRHLWTVELHAGVIDSEGGQCGEEVLDGLHGDSVHRKRRGVVLAPDISERGRDLDGSVGSDEADSVFGGSGAQREADRPARMEADPGAGHVAEERSSVGHSCCGLPETKIACCEICKGWASSWAA